MRLRAQLEDSRLRIIAIALMEDSLDDIQRFYDRYNIRNLRIYQDRDHLASARLPRRTPATACVRHPQRFWSAPKDTISLRIPGAPGWERPKGIKLLRVVSGQCLERFAATGCAGFFRAPLLFQLSVGESTGFDGLEVLEQPARRATVAC